MRAMSSDGQPMELAQSAVDALRAALRGPLLMAGDPGYEDARTIWNAMIDRRPALVARPLGVADSPGYEDAYYDAGANRMRGGLFDRFRGDRFVAGTFRELFDYHPSAIKSGLGYGALEALISGYFYTGIRDILGFSLMILALFLKPEGLFGRHLEERA